MKHRTRLAPRLGPQAVNGISPGAGKRLFATGNAAHAAGVEPPPEEAVPR